MNQAGYGWLIFALMTVSCWGLYGVFLHSGQLGMADPVNGRYKAFLFVGIAYFLVAVLAPLAILAASGADWHYPMRGMTMSLIAGTVGGLGAFGVFACVRRQGHAGRGDVDHFRRGAYRERAGFHGTPPASRRSGRNPLAVLRGDRLRGPGWVSGLALQAEPCTAQTARSPDGRRDGVRNPSKRRNRPLAAIGWIASAT